MKTDPVTNANVIRPAISLFILLTIITGLIYPFLITGLGQAIFPNQANGSLIELNGKLIGSKLIGQQFSGSHYFWSRPSATSPVYNPSASSGSNLGPTNPVLFEQVTQRMEAIKAAHPTNAQPIPIDLMTASASGLDPDISLAAAYYQAARIAQARKLPIEQIHALIQQFAQKPVLGLWGEPSINVLRLNIALDGGSAWR